jgi:ABC-type phosphate/phosphonate transport system substrate-binding protein
VPTGDPAKTVRDLKGYRIFFGTADCAEKYDAALEMLRTEGVPIPEKIETSAACSEGAIRILELGAKVRGAAMISSYAKPLLEGCGTVKKGELRVVGETKPVPFVTAFVSNALPAKEQRRIAKALLAVGSQPELCVALETVLGFVAIEDQPAAAKKKASPKRGRSDASG